MALVTCSECGGRVSSEAPACPHCGYPDPSSLQKTLPARPSAPPPSGGGISAGWLILGIVVLGALVVGLFGLGVYRVLQRVEQRSERRPEELVDFADSATKAAPSLPPEDSSYELSAVEEQPVLLNRDEIAANISRSYPPLLRDAGVTGSVTLRMRVGSDGRVDPWTIEVVESTHDLFSQAASNVAGRLRFRPARVGGKPVPVWITLPVTFQLEP
jgi:TonB family protein